MNCVAQGCQFCLRGQKLVLFVTGVCSRKCYFCPVGDHKFGKDVIFANERPVKTVDDVFLEVDCCRALGCGITGGDPLCRLDRTVEYIVALKKKYGKKFHIHLYTPLELVSSEILQRLFDAGLDEIRFHPNLDDDSLWDRISLSRAFSWSVGVEVPALPGKEVALRKIVDSVSVSFFNFNELEVADNAQSTLLDQGFLVKDSLSYGISGSEELALKMVSYCQEKGIVAYYCSAFAKDHVQLMERVKRRAAGVQQHFDILTSDVTFIRGAIYEEKPSFGYRESLARKNKEVEVRRLRQLRTTVCTSLRIAKSEIVVDPVKYRLLCSRKVVVSHQQAIRDLGLIPAIVEEMPTYDLFEIELEFLGVE